MPLSAGIVLVNSQVEMDDLEVAGAGIGVEIRGARLSRCCGASAIHDCAGEGVLISGASAPGSRTTPSSGMDTRAWLLVTARAPRWSVTFSKRTPVELAPDVKMDAV